MEIKIVKRRVVVWCDKSGGVKVTSFTKPEVPDKDIQTVIGRLPEGATVLPVKYSDELPDAPTEALAWDGEKLVVADLKAAAAPVWESVRSERDRRLEASDWRVLPDAPDTEGQKAAWTAYRQALRDITNQPDPKTIVWPEPPKG